MKNPQKQKKKSIPIAFKRSVKKMKDPTIKIRAKADIEYAPIG